MMGLVFLQGPSWQTCVGGHEPVFGSSQCNITLLSSCCSNSFAHTLTPSGGTLNPLVFSQIEDNQPPTFKNDLMKTTLFFRRQQMFFLLSAAPRAQFPHTVKEKWNQLVFRGFTMTWRRCTYSRGTAEGNQPWSKELMKLHLFAMAEGPAHTVPVYRQSSHFLQETPQKLTNPFNRGEKQFWQNMVRQNFWYQLNLN